jgi:hypothetical protein
MFAPRELLHRVAEELGAAGWHPHPTGLSCRASAVRRFAADPEQRAAALGAVSLPAGTPVGQGHLPRVGDGDLLAADAPGLRAGILCL